MTKDKTESPSNINMFFWCLVSGVIGGFVVYIAHVRPVIKSALATMFNLVILGMVIYMLATAYKLWELSKIAKQKVKKDANK